MEKTSSRLLLTEQLVNLLRNTKQDNIKKIIYLIQGKIYPDYEGIELGLAEKLTIKAIAESIGTSVKEIEKIYAKTGDLGNATAEIARKKYQKTLFSEKITVNRVYSTFEKIAKASGSGSQLIKLRLVSSLLNDATPIESKYIVKFLLGTLRLGIADFSIIDALAIRYTGDKSNRKIIEKSYSIYSDLGKIAEILDSSGLDELNLIKITPFKPIRPMLAERVQSDREALKRSDNSIALEYKLDGERVQIHKYYSQIELFSRSLEKITPYYPDIVNGVSNLNVDSLIVEAEIVPIDNNKKIQPFQELMHRKRKYNIDSIIKKYPIKLYIFDILYLNGTDYTAFDYLKRRKTLEIIFKDNKNDMIDLVPQSITSNSRYIKKFFTQATKNGSEGLMLKRLNSSYRAGAREFSWMKLKKEYDKALGDTFDLTVIGALLGRGKRTGYYGALLLASYEKNSGSFESICKVGTGFTDKDLELIYNELKNDIVNEKYYNVKTNMKMNVWFRPNLVLEIIASEITLSPSHTAAINSIRENFGLALRFPKFSGKIRFDKKPEDSTTSKELIDLYQRQIKKNI